MNLLGAAGLSVLSGCGGVGQRDRTGGTSSSGSGGVDQGGSGGAADACAAKAETTVGPYPNLGPLERKDVRGNTSGDTTPKAGAELTLRVRLLDRDALCAPLAGAVVEIWQCDAVGAYAGYDVFSTVGEDFCRGAQLTDAQGVAEFLTIFPGSYSGRTVHIHFSIRKAAGSLPPNNDGNILLDVFVAQLYFEADAAAEVFEAFPIYQQGAAITPNELDGFFPDGGPELLVDMTQSGAGYVGEVTVGVRRSEVGL